MTKCKSRQKQKTCEADGKCHWEHQTCNPLPFDEWTHLCSKGQNRTKILEYASIFGVPNAEALHTTELCQQIQERLLNEQATHPTRTVAQVFNDIVFSQPSPPQSPSLPPPPTYQSALNMPVITPPTSAHFAARAQMPVALQLAQRLPPQCHTLKSADRCHTDQRCHWFNNKCRLLPYHQWKRICESKPKMYKHKPILIQFAKAFGVQDADTMKTTQLCLIIERAIEDHQTINPLRSPENIFNDVILNQSQAPIITESVLEDLVHSSSSGSVKRVLQFPMGNREKFATYVDRVINPISRPLNICSSTVLKIVHRIGSASKYGEAHICSLKYRGHDLAVARKKMPNTPENQKEVQFYEQFKSVVIGKQNPHFPIIYASKECTNCTYENGRIMDPTRGAECMVTLAELANGDLESWFRQPRSYEECMSMFAQIIIACVTLGIKGLVHNDLHWGNVLYHVVPQYTNMYMHYVYNNNHVYVRNCGYHWVLWDFGMMRPVRKDQESMNPDIWRIAGMTEWLHEDANTNMPRGAEVVISMMSKLATRTPIQDTFQMLKHLNALLYVKDLIQINPAQPPPASQVFDTYVLI